MHVKEQCTLTFKGGFEAFEGFEGGFEAFVLSFEAFELGKRLRSLWRL